MNTLDDSPFERTGDTKAVCFENGQDARRPE